jgi:NADP-dependent 3-hydroxy acid dehydrogenase YdfG
MNTAHCEQFLQQTFRNMDALIQQCKLILICIMHVIQQFILYIHDITWKAVIYSGRTTAYIMHLPTPYYHPAILITGTSTDIGREAALALAQQGYTVLAGVRQKVDGAVLAEELELLRQNNANDEESILNGTVVPIIMDLASEATIAEGWSQVEARFAELDIPLVGLINNASMITLKMVEQLTIADWNQMLWANFLGAVELTRLALPLLRASRGRIVNNGSIAA